MQFKQDTFFHFFYLHLIHCQFAQRHVILTFRMKRKWHYTFCTLDGRVFLQVYSIKTCDLKPSVNHLHGQQAATSFFNSPDFTCTYFGVKHSQTLNHIKRMLEQQTDFGFCSCYQLTNIRCFVDLYYFSQIKVPSYDGHLGAQREKGKNVQNTL